MNRTPKAPNTELPNPVNTEQFDVDLLLEKASEILRREIMQLMGKSSRGKLEKGDAQDLVNYIKLLHEIKKDQVKELANMTDEEIKKADEALQNKRINQTDESK